MHIFLVVGWILLTWPTITAWKNSVLVVLLYSIYANACTHWGAYEAARAKELQQLASSQADETA